VRGIRRGILQSIQGVLIAAIVALSCGELWALDPHKQIGQYGHDSWTSQRGLPGEAVYQILQSKDGYLWIRTDSGLARFDGARFVSMDAEIATDPVRAICMSADGDLLIRTTSRTILYKDGRFRDYMPPAKLPDGATNVLFETREHKVLVGAENFIYELQPSGPKLLMGHSERINGFLEDRTGRTWVGGSARLYTYAAGKLSPASTGSLSGRYGYSLMEDHLHRLWAGGKPGIYRIDGDPSGPPPIVEAGSLTQVNAIIEDSQGNVWMGTQTQGLARLSGDTLSSFDSLSGLTDNKVSAIFQDREGTIWVGTGSGLDRFRDTKLTTLTVRDGLPSNNLGSIFYTREGSLYAFCYNGGLATLEHDAFRAFAHNDKLPALYGPAMFEGKNGSLWVGTGGGLSRIKNGKLTVYSGDGHFSKSYLSMISEDNESLIVANAESNVYRFKDGKVTPFTLRGQTTPITYGIYVLSMYYDPSGVLWAGTVHGFFKFVPGASPQTARRSEIDVPVTTILDDHQGNLWLGGRFPGLMQYRVADGRVTRYGKRNGLFDGYVSRVLPDDNGNLWMSTENGIYVAREKDLNDFADQRTTHVPATAYGLADGMKTGTASDTSSQPGGARTTDGRLWFTTTKGLVFVDPAHVLHNAQVPPVVIETVVTDGTVRPGDAEVTIPPGARDIEFHYTALSFVIPERVRFKYRLEGYDTDWVDAGPRRVAYYSNLRPGSYRFLVIAANDDGVWNEQGASVEIRIEPRFYQTWLFDGLCLLLAGLAIVAGNRLNTRFIRRRAAQLSRLIEEQTAELRKSHMELEQLANCDALTSLPNRRLFTLHFAKLIEAAQRRGEPLALLLIDFDKFKHINDTFGHDAGDAFLIEASVRLQASIRSADCVSRLGGDEFAVLLSNDPAEHGIAAVCNRIVESFDTPVYFKTTEIRSSASIGVAVFPEHGLTQELLYKSADLALYEAKRGGRNNWRWHNPAKSTGESQKETEQQAKDSARTTL
jgi:diguanylate cyclase (GGDEF)-like protein